MQYIPTAPPSFVGRAFNNIFLWFGRRKNEALEKQIADYRRALQISVSRYDKLLASHDQLGARVEQIDAMGVRQLPDGTWYFDMNAILCQMDDDDLRNVSDIVVKIMDRRLERRVPEIAQAAKPKKKRAQKKRK